jgi:hypothetical protein
MNMNFANVRSRLADPKEPDRLPTAVQQTTHRVLPARIADAGKMAMHRLLQDAFRSRTFSGSPNSTGRREG